MSGETCRNRILAWMIYLNDIKTGGGTHFIIKIILQNQFLEIFIFASRLDTHACRS